MKKLLTFGLAFAALAASAAVPFRIGVAGYTFNKRTLDDTLAIMQKADVHSLCVKDFHLPFSATDEEIAAFKAKCAAFGVTPYAIGFERLTKPHIHSLAISGLHDLGDMKLLVSKGIGASRLQLRVGVRPEINLLLFE